MRIGPVAEVGDGALLHLLGRRRVDRAGALEGAVGVVGRLVEARDVDALDASELTQRVLPGLGRALPCDPASDDLGDLSDRLLAVAQPDAVDEGEHGRASGRERGCPYV